MGFQFPFQGEQFLWLASFSLTFCNMENDSLKRPRHPDSSSNEGFRCTLTQFVWSLLLSHVAVADRS